MKIRQIIEDSFRFFLTNQFLFDCHKSQQLYHALSESDRAQFGFDLSVLDWRQYHFNFVYGIITHLLKREVILEGYDPRNYVLEYRKYPFRDLRWSIKRY